MKSLIFFALIVLVVGISEAAIIVSRPPVAYSTVNGAYYNGYTPYGYYRLPQYGYRQTGPVNVGYTTYTRYPSYAYTGSYYPYVSTLGGYSSIPVDPAYSNIIFKKK